MTMFRSCWADGLNHVGSRLPDEYRLDSGGTSVAGRVGDLRPGLGQQNLPTFVILTDAGGGVGRPEELELRIPARHLSGHAVPPRGRADSGPGAAGHHRRRAAARPARSAASSLNRHFGDDKAGRHRTGSAPQFLRARLSDAIGGARSGGSHQGNGSHEEALRHGRRGDGEVRHQLPAGAAAGGARRALRRTLFGQRQRLGRAQRSRKQSHAGAARHPTSRSPAC